MTHRFNSESNLYLAMKMAEPHLGLSIICCNGYRHPPEAMGEAEGLLFAKCYLTM